MNIYLIFRTVKGGNFEVEQYIAAFVNAGKAEDFVNNINDNGSKSQFKIICTQLR